jgi:BirA family biotin operon repressor/biotin-[acetyl-CoA-carboxylase] ligase
VENSLNRETITSQLTTQWLGYPVYYFPEIGSTNDHLKELARVGEPAGAMVVADFQTSGKGRLDRDWLAPSGTALLFSLLFRPEWPADRANWLVMIAGLATVEAIKQETGLTAGIKWPNDVVIYQSGQWLKAAGILLETEIIQEALGVAVVGIGININQREDDLPKHEANPISLRMASGQIWSRNYLLVSLLKLFEDRYNKVIAGESPQTDWNLNLVNIGKQVTVSQIGSDSLIKGLAVGTDEKGWLLVEDAAGKIHEVPAGDVTLRG